MRTARRSRVCIAGMSSGLLTAAMASLAILSYSDIAVLNPILVPPDTAHDVPRVESSSLSPQLPLAPREPVPIPVELPRDVKGAPIPATIGVVSRAGMGRSKDDFINAADAISEHITSLDLPVPREVVRVVTLAPVDMRRLPEPSTFDVAGDLSGMFSLAAQSMAAMPASRTAVSRAGRKTAISIAQDENKRVAGFVKRAKASAASNVPVPVRVSVQVPARTFVAAGTLRTHPLRAPAIKSAGPGIVTSAHMVLSGQ